YAYVLANPLRWIDPTGQHIAAPPATIPGMVQQCSNDSECQKEWEDAREFCDQIAADNRWGSGWSVGGRHYLQCVMGQVSERCGGNKVDHEKSPVKTTGSKRPPSSDRNSNLSPGMISAILLMSILELAF